MILASDPDKLTSIQRGNMTAPMRRTDLVLVKSLKGCTGQGTRNWESHTSIITRFPTNWHDRAGFARHMKYYLLW